MTKTRLSLLATGVLGSTIAGLAAFWPSPAPVSQAPIIKETPLAERAVVQAVTNDSLTHPPLRQTFSSGAYQLVVSAEDQWETPLATSELYEGAALLWQKDLPHQYGPRFALVSDQGQVLLLDEFINVASPHALTLIDTEGEVVAQHSFEDIKKALDVTPSALTQQATSGWWISAPPTVTAKGDLALVKAGGTTLEIDLTTGQLSRRADL
ncbi:MAG: hypothetical protein AAGC93_05580 [Cyanobacteria bacterium P01_F01_bin.53]